MAGFLPVQARLDDLMARKNGLELEYSQLRLHCLRLETRPAYTVDVYKRQTPSRVWPAASATVRSRIVSAPR